MVCLEKVSKGLSFVESMGVMLEASSGLRNTLLLLIKTIPMCSLSISDSIQVQIKLSAPITATETSEPKSREISMSTWMVWRCRFDARKSTFLSFSKTISMNGDRCYCTREKEGAFGSDYLKTYGYGKSPIHRGKIYFTIFMNFKDLFYRLVLPWKALQED